MMKSVKKMLGKLASIMGFKITRIRKNSRSPIKVEKKIINEEFDVVVYFFGEKSQFYQLEQWLPVFNELSKHKKMFFAVRSMMVKKILNNKEIDNVTCLRSLDSLTSFYNNNKIGCVLYVNNGVKNFQSLIEHRVLHVHINHGESEKSSMYSNQSKAYDYVLCAGERAIQRYKDNLLKLDDEKYISIGRPQLDFIMPSERIETDKKIVLYAPTWASTHESMNYSSIAIAGENIIKNLIESDEYYIVYRPHPSVGITCNKEKTAHESILSLIESNPNAILHQDNSILNIFHQVDFAIFDNSSVTIDYLKFDKPFLVLNRFKEWENIPHYCNAGILINPENVSDIASLINSEMKADQHINSRKKIREEYFAMTGKGEATARFLQVIDQVCKESDLLKNKIKYEQVK